MEKPSFKLVGAPCGQHGQYTFYKALRVSGERDRIVAIGEFFFVRIWQDSELVSIGELQLLWTDRVSDQTLVSLRLYFLPENTPDGRSLHGEDEVMVINEKVVLKAEDLLSWMCDGGGWSTGVRAVWRGACAPPGPGAGTDALHATRLDFSDVDKEKGALEPDPSSPGVVVFSYPRYCRYRAVAARLGGVQAAWLRDALVAALGGYAAPTANTRILYCKESFEYPELEGHEFVCNHLAPRLKGRPRGRRRRQPRSRDRERRSDGERSSDSDAGGAKAPRRVSLRNGASPEQLSDEEAPSERAFLRRLRLFYRGRDDAPPEMQSPGDLKHLSLGSVYTRVVACGGFASACRRRAWRALQPDRPHRLRDAYQRYLLPYENHERSRGRLPALSQRRNGSLRVGSSGPMILDAIDTIDVTDSPPRDTTETEETPEKKEIEKRLRTPSPQREEDSKEEFTISKPAEELNREFLDSLPKEDKPEKPLKISVKPVEKLIERNDKEKSNIAKLFEENSALVAELSAKHKVMDSKVIDEIASRNLSEGSTMFLNELAVRLNLGPMEASLLRPAPPALNGHDTQQQPPRPPPAHPAARSSLRHVRVKPARTPQTHTQTQQTHRGIGHVPATGVTSPAPRPRERHSDDEIVEVPYKPKTPEIIDLDEYPESPQSQVKKKKLDILKERGLEVTAIPTPQWGVPPQVPLMGGLNPPVMLNPAMQHQIMTQASLFQMYNIIPQNYANGIQPPKVIQATCTFGTSGPEKTVYGNPKDPFMPPPHVLHGAPIKPQRNLTPTEHPEPPLPPRPDILDLTCKVVGQPAQKPAVEIVRIPQAPSPSKIAAQNLSKNYTLIDGKAVVGSNLEITLVNPKNSQKNRPPQKRSSNGKFVSTKTPTPPKDYPKPYPSPSNIKKQPIIVPNYPLNRDEVSPASSTSSRDSLKQDIPKTIMDIQKSAALDMHKVNMLDMQKSAASLMDMQKSMPNMLDMQKSIPTMLDMHKSMPNMLDMQKSMPSMLDMQKSMPSMLDMQKSMPAMSHFMDPLYMNALYNSLAGQMDQRQLAMYRDLVANQFRGYPGMLSSVTPTTKN